MVKYLAVKHLEFLYSFFFHLELSQSFSHAEFICSVGVHTVLELKEMQERMKTANLMTYNLTENDLVKDHLRYLVYTLHEHLLSKIYGVFIELRKVT